MTPNTVVLSDHAIDPAIRTRILVALTTTECKHAGHRAYPYALASRFFQPVRGRDHCLSMAEKDVRGKLLGETVRLKQHLDVLRRQISDQPF